MSLTPNQFSQSANKGSLDLSINPNVISGRVAQSQSTKLVSGQAVALANTLSKIPEFVAASATDNIWGFVCYSLMKNSFKAGDAITIASKGSYMYMEANGAIAQGAEVEIVADGQKITTALGTNSKIGFAFDKASALGDLIRVFIDTPCLK
jgi:hypothetical protein